MKTLLYTLFFIAIGFSIKAQNLEWKTFLVEKYDKFFQDDPWQTPFTDRDLTINNSYYDADTDAISLYLNQSHAVKLTAINEIQFDVRQSQFTKRNDVTSSEFMLLHAFDNHIVGGRTEPLNYIIVDMKSGSVLHSYEIPHGGDLEFQDGIAVDGSFWLPFASNNSSPNLTFPKNGFIKIGSDIAAFVGWETSSEEFTPSRFFHHENKLVFYRKRYPYTCDSSSVNNCVTLTVADTNGATLSTHTTLDHGYTGNEVVVGNHIYALTDYSAAGIHISNRGSALLMTDLIFYNSKATLLREQPCNMINNPCYPYYGHKNLIYSETDERLYAAINILEELPAITGINGTLPSKTVLVAFSFTGEILWQNEYQNDANYFVHRLQEIPGGVALIGSRNDSLLMQNDSLDVAIALVSNDGGAYEYPTSRIDQDNDFDGVSVFPNPAKSTLQLKGLQDDETFNYEIINISDQVFKSGQLFKATSLSLEGLNSGVYVLNLENKSGKQAFRRFVKE